MFKKEIEIISNDLDIENSARVAIGRELKSGDGAISACIALSSSSIPYQYIYKRKSNDNPFCLLMYRSYSENINDLKTITISKFSSDNKSINKKSIEDVFVEWSGEFYTFNDLSGVSSVENAIKSVENEIDEDIKRSIKSGRVVIKEVDYI